LLWLVVETSSLWHCLFKSVVHILIRKGSGPCAYAVMYWSQQNTVFCWLTFFIILQAVQMSFSFDFNFWLAKGCIMGDSMM